MFFQRVQLCFQPVERGLAVDQLAEALGVEALADLLPDCLLAEVALFHQVQSFADDLAGGIVAA